MSSFVHEIPLKTTPHDIAVLDTRIDTARQLYNACLQESLRRLGLMRESKQYRFARTLPKGKPRNKAFKDIRERHQSQEYSLHAFAAETKNACWIGDHLDSNTVQKIASRAFDATEKYAYGKRGRPRFKRFGWLNSVEGKNNKSGIRWRDGRVVWSGLELHPRFDLKDKHGVEAHALSCKVKYLRLVKRIEAGITRWSVQLVLGGTPHQKDKNIIPIATVGLDIGPSTIAAVSDSDASLDQFCDEVIHPWEQIKTEQRLQDRSRRKTNPANYKADGSVIKGSRKWHRSNRYKKRQDKIAELQRVLAATRKNQHGRMANKILAQGNQIKTEKLSYKSFQKNFGRSVSVRAPGMFVTLLTRKAENAGGSVEPIKTRNTKLSQTCICGSVVKKPLSQRMHSCKICGTESQRDLFSAYLAKHCTSDQLDISQAKLSWPAAKPLLERAMFRVNQTANRGLLPASFGVSRRQSCSPVKNGSISIEAGNVVVAGNSYESPGEMLFLPLEPPGFIHGEV
jgi:transposase